MCVCMFIYVGIKIGTDLRGEMSKKWGENAKRKLFLLMLTAEKRTIANKPLRSENPNPTRLLI